MSSAGLVSRRHTYISIDILETYAYAYAVQEILEQDGMTIAKLHDV